MGKKHSLSIVASGSHTYCVSVRIFCSNQIHVALILRKCRLRKKKTKRDNGRYEKNPHRRRLGSLSFLCRWMICNSNALILLWRGAKIRSGLCWPGGLYCLPASPHLPRSPSRRLFRHICIQAESIVDEAVRCLRGGARMYLAILESFTLHKTLTALFL